MSRPPATVAAVDLGAGSGRVMQGIAGPDTLQLKEISRFDNTPVRVNSTLHWDALRLYHEIVAGLRQAREIESVGIDSWGCDYALLDADGRLLGNPVHHRDGRTEGVMERVLGQVSGMDLYSATGLQLLPFNTLFQLVAARDEASFAAARTMLLIPDLIAYWLTGRIGTERTNASTTQLLDVRTGQWATDLMNRLGLPTDLLAPLREPGSPIGPILAETGIGTVPVTAVASHDTASAVVGVPAVNDAFAYISCGTWSLVGVELSRPVLTAASREANFTNEVGVDGSIRYLRNVMGLWLLQECQRAWREAGLTADLETLLASASRVPAFGAVIDVDDPAMLPPGDMPARIGAECRRFGQQPPASPAETVRCIMDSLALGHRAALLGAQRHSGREVEVIHIVGGGARNALLCQLTADACGLPVEAGPQEATALGNVLIQARALGKIEPDLSAMRSLIRATHPITRYEPRGDLAAWTAAATRLS